MPLFWGNTGTIPTSGMVPTSTEQYLTSFIYTGMTNQTQLCTQAAITAYFGLNDPGHTHMTTWFLGDDVNSAQYYYLAQNRVVAYQERLGQRDALQALRMREARERNEAAVARSRELLLEHLTPAQRETFEKKKWFVVEGGKTKMRYRIRTESYAGNIDEMKDDKVVARLCIHCDDVPLHDHHLAQKLALEYDEERVLKVANRTRVA